MSATARHSSVDGHSCDRARCERWGSDDADLAGGLSLHEIDPCDWHTVRRGTASTPLGAGRVGGADPPNYVHITIGLTS
jgi:hypothetical protein